MFVDCMQSGRLFHRWEETALAHQSLQPFKFDFGTFYNRSLIWWPMNPLSDYYIDVLYYWVNCLCYGAACAWWYRAIYNIMPKSTSNLSNFAVQLQW